MSFREFILEESSSGDVASTENNVTPSSKKKKVISKKRTYKCDEDEVNEATVLPENILRNAGIKIKSSDMDDESYVILLFDKKDVEKAKEVLKAKGYEVTNVNKLLYIS